MLSNTSEKLGDSHWAMLVTAEPATFPAGTLNSAPEQQAPWGTERLMSPKALCLRKETEQGGTGGTRKHRGPGQRLERPPASSCPFVQLTRGSNQKLSKGQRHSSSPAQGPTAHSSHRLLGGPCHGGLGSCCRHTSWTSL